MLLRVLHAPRRTPCRPRCSWRRTARNTTRLRDRQLALGAAEPLVGLPGLAAPAPARADRRCRCPRTPCAARAARCSADRSRRRACGTASTARRPDRCRARPCAAPRSGRRTARPSCRSADSRRPTTSPAIVVGDRARRRPAPDRPRPRAGSSARRASPSAARASVASASSSMRHAPRRRPRSRRERAPQHLLRRRRPSANAARRRARATATRC